MDEDMRTFLYRNFQQAIKKEKISLDSLRVCATELNDGLFDAKLGNGLYKKRLAKEGKGKRGSYRTILAFTKNERTFFLYLFEKNKRVNINKEEKEIYKELAKMYLTASDATIEALLKTKTLTEV